MAYPGGNYPGYPGAYPAYPGAVPTLGGAPMPTERE